MTLEQLQSWQERMRDHLHQWNGDMPPRGPLNVREQWRREFWCCTEVKLDYEGEVGERIPAYLLLPRRPLRTPCPAIFAAHQCCGWCDIGKEQVVGKCPDAPDQAYGYELVKEGFAVLAPDANMIGERYDPALRKPWQTLEDFPDQSRCCTAPRGPFGSVRWKRVFDVMRGIDFLQGLDAIDPTRIGMIGHSLGGATTLWAMSMDERIRVGVASGGGDGRSEDGREYGLPLADLLSLLAPRPCLLVTGLHDIDIRPPDVEARETERMAAWHTTFTTARATYRLLGNEDALQLCEFDGGHSFPVEARRTAYEWFKRWLL